jgi:two-component system KDP operon response regulator KdpE
MAKQNRSTASKSPIVSAHERREWDNELAALVDLSSDAFMLFDENLDLIAINSAGARLFSITKDAAENNEVKNLLDLIPHIRDTNVQNKFHKALKSGKPITLDDVVITTDSGDLHLNIKAIKIQNYIGVLASDITEQKQAYERSLYSEIYYKALIENALDPVIIINGDGTIQYKSQSIEQVLGYGTEEDIGGSSFNYIHPDDLPDVADIFTQLISNPGSTMRYVVRVLHADGSWRTIEAIGQNLLDNPAVAGVVASFRDVTEYKQAQLELRSSEEKFRNVLDNSFDMVYRLNFTKGTYDYISPSSQQLLGYKPEEFIALGAEHAVSLIHPDDRDGVSTKIIKLMEPSSQRDMVSTIEYRIKHRELGYRWVADNISVMQNEAKIPVAVVGNLRDITERKRADEALRDSEEKLQAMFESVEDGITVTDLEGKILQVNNAVVHIHGYNNKDELLGLSGFELIAERDRSRAIENMRRTLNEGSISNLEYKFLSKEKKEFDAELGVSLLRDASGTPSGFIGITRDISERRRMQEALQQSEEHFRALIENSLEAIAIVNRDGILTYESPSFERLMGYTLKDHIGKSPFEYIHEDDLQRISNMFTEMSQDPGSTARSELRVWHSDRTLRTVEVVGQNLLDNPAVGGIVANIRDITERKQAEEELRQLYKQEREVRQQLQDEIKRRVEFTRALAHELKTPLTSVLASSDLLAAEVHDEPLQTLARTIQQGASNLDSRIDELLDLARGEVGMLQLKLEPVDIAVLLRQTADSMTALASRRGQSLALSLPLTLPTVRADAARLQQIITNLLNNAIKFTPVGGNIKLGARQKESAVIVEVKDTGRGISKEDQRLLFEPYQRLQRDSSVGLGLGLALCKTLIELHNGQIWVKSNVGKGSTFGFSLPLTETYLKPVETEEVSKLWKVLIIEDDQDIVSSVSVAFQMRWPEAHLISTGLGEDGLEMVETENPDLVILDIGLPDIDGFDVLRQIRLFSSVPVIILTVKAEEADMVKGLEWGADDYVAKPFRQLELLARLKVQLRKQAPTDEEAPITVGSLRLDPATFQLTYGGREISLTLVEGRIMQYLMQNAGHVVTHSRLAEAVWEEDHPGAVDSLRVYIRHLREKLESDASNPKLIITKVGVGYMLAKPVSI